jgi:hypothetical protein
VKPRRRALRMSGADDDGGGGLGEPPRAPSRASGPSRRAWYQGGHRRSRGGSVTAPNQTIVGSDAGSARTERLKGLIEINADIQAGDSGRPLVTSSGVVIGMDTAASSTSGYPFGTSSTTTTQAYAIPINCLG